MRDTQKDMVTASEHNNNDTIGSIVLSEESDIKYNVYIYEYDSKILQQNHCFELYVIGNVILTERQKNLFSL